MSENNRIEYKRALADDLEREVTQRHQPMTPRTTGVGSGVESGGESLMALKVLHLSNLEVQGKPNSRKRKYRLTAKGLGLLRHLDKGK